MNDLTVIVVVLFGFLVVTGTGFYLIYRIPILVQRIRYNRETRNYEKAFAKKKQIKREKARGRTAKVLRHFGARALAFVSGAREVLSSLVFQFVFLLFFVRERLSVMFYRELVLAPAKIPSVPKKFSSKKNRPVRNSKESIKKIRESLIESLMARFPQKPKATDEEIRERLERRQEEMYGIKIVKEQESVERYEWLIGATIEQNNGDGAGRNGKRKAEFFLEGYRKGGGRDKR